MFLTITWYIFLSLRQQVFNAVQRSSFSSMEKNRVHKKVSPITIITRIMFRSKNIKVIFYLTKARGMK